MKNITTIALFTLLAFASLNSNAQRTASLIIDSTSIKFQGDLSASTSNKGFKINEAKRTC